MREWTTETGKKVGVAFAESYRTITLERRSGDAAAARAVAEGVSDSEGSVVRGGSLA